MRGSANTGASGTEKYTRTYGRGPRAVDTDASDVVAAVRGSYCLSTVKTSLLETYLRSTRTVECEHTDAALEVVEGEVPRDLRGVLYRNGPGKMEVFGQPYGHPFDGDGMVTRFSFEKGAVRYTNRYVQTLELRAEARAQRMLYRSFGTNLPGGVRRNALRLNFKNAANTSVVLHAGRLLALWEGGLPHALDPVTLFTHGRYDYAGRLQNPGSRLARAVAPELPFSAHPKRDVDTGDLVNFGTLIGPQPRLALYRVDPAGVMGAPRLVDLEALSFVHDFVLTRRYAVFFLPSVAFDIPRTFLGLTTPVASLRSRPGGGSKVLLVPRDGGAPRRIAMDDGFVFHFANGFDDADGRVIVDAMRLPDLPRADATVRFLAGEDVALPEARPTRFVIDPVRGTVVSHAPVGFSAELPTVDPRTVGRAYRSFWAVAGNGPSQGPFMTRVARVEMATGAVQSIDFAPDLPGEPVFVPRPGSSADEGWVLVVVYRAATHRSDLVVLDAEGLAPVCRLALPHHLPPGFHGTWAPAAGTPG